MRKLRYSRLNSLSFSWADNFSVCSSYLWETWCSFMFIASLTSESNTSMIMLCACVSKTILSSMLLHLIEVFLIVDLLMNEIHWSSYVYCHFSFTFSISSTYVSNWFVIIVVSWCIFVFWFMTESKESFAWVLTKHMTFIKLCSIFNNSFVFLMFLTTNVVNERLRRIHFELDILCRFINSVVMTWSVESSSWDTENFLVECFTSEKHFDFKRNFWIILRIAFCSDLSSDHIMFKNCIWRFIIWCLDKSLLLLYRSLIIQLCSLTISSVEFSSEISSALIHCFSCTSAKLFSSLQIQRCDCSHHFTSLSSEKSLSRIFFSERRQSSRFKSFSASSEFLHHKAILRCSLDVFL